MSNPSPNKPLEQLKVTELRDELKKRGLSYKGVKKELCERLEDAMKTEENNGNGDEAQQNDGDEENENGEDSHDPMDKIECEAKATRMHENPLHSYKLSETEDAMNEDGLHTSKFNEIDVAMNDAGGLTTNEIEFPASMSENSAFKSSTKNEFENGNMQQGGSVTNSNAMKENEAPALVPEDNAGGCSNEEMNNVSEDKAGGCSSYQITKTPEGQFIDNTESGKAPFDDTVCSGDKLKGVHESQSLDKNETESAIQYDEPAADVGGDTPNRPETGLVQTGGRKDEKDIIIAASQKQPVEDTVATEKNISVQLAVSVGDVHIQCMNTASVSDREVSQLKGVESSINKVAVSCNVVAMSRPAKNQTFDPTTSKTTETIACDGLNVDCDTSVVAITKNNVLAPIPNEVDANLPSHNVISKHELCDQVSKHDTIDENKDKLVLIRADVSTVQDTPGNVVDDKCKNESAEGSIKHTEISETKRQQEFNIACQETDNINDINLLTGKESDCDDTIISEVGDANIKETSNKDVVKTSHDVEMEEAANTQLNSQFNESEDVNKQGNKIEFAQQESKISESSVPTYSGNGQMNDLHPLEGKRESFSDQKDSETSSSFKRRDDDTNQEPAKRMRRWCSSKESTSSNVKPLTTGTIKEIIALDKMEDMSSASPKNKTSRLLAVKADNEANGKEHGAPNSTRPPTTSLKVERFVRPFTLIAAKSLMSEFGQCVEFWMDQIKTHCFVTYSTTEEAIAARNGLYGKKWPPSFGNLLTAEFVDPSEVKVRCEGLLEKANGVPSANPAQIPRAIPNALPAQQGYPSGSGRVNSNAANTRERPLPQAPKNPEPVVLTLDDLFMKTKAKPHIYYMPLTDEEVAKRLASSKIQEQHPQRRRFGRV